jgi:hypothetical protein
LDLTGLLRIILDLLPEPLNMHRQSLLFRKAVIAPDAVEQKFLRKCLALIFSQKQKQIKFLSSHIKGLIVLIHRPAQLIDPDITTGKLIHSISALEDTGDLRQHNVDIIGLFDVVIGTQDQTAELIFLAGFGADD